jgi:diaminopimelate decarboxylase
VTDTAAATLPLAAVLPLSAGVSAAGRLSLGGCDVHDLVAEYGTPLYVYDLRTLREQCRDFMESFRGAYPDCDVLYASKAFLNRPFARFIAAQGLGFDAVSGGEIEVLRSAGVDLGTVYFHGNNKTPAELRLAVEAGVGRIVIDNEGEVALLDGIAGAAGQRQRVLVRVSPGIDAHTHEKTTTGIVDSKFGVPIVTGAAERTVAAIAAAPHLEFRGLHMHLGSPIFETEPYVQGIEVMARFIADICIAKLGVEVPEFSPGGGFAVAYHDDQQSQLPRVATYAGVISATLRREADRLGFPLPHITVEPGRAIVARAAVALYTVGARKEIPGVRTYVSVDGGMADNIRPAMYGARYQAIAAERPLADVEETVSIAGKYCESGDVLIQEAAVPRLRAGELLAIPAAGAYQLSMESNYNLAYRPAVVTVEDGAARLIRRRQTLEDLVALDVD